MKRAPERLEWIEFLGNGQAIEYKFRYPNIDGARWELRKQLVCRTRGGKEYAFQDVPVRFDGVALIPQDCGYMRDRILCEIAAKQGRRIQ